MYEWLWLGAVVVFLVLEASTMTLVSLWFAVGSAVALIAELSGADFTVQFVLFLLVSVLFLLLLRRFALKSLCGKRHKTNLDRIIGESVIILEDVDNTKGSGSVKIGDVVWRAKSADGSIIERGESATVLEIDGVKLVLEKDRKDLVL